MFHVSIEQKHKWKFGRTRNAVGTQATSECFHNFFKIFQTLTSGKHRHKEKENKLSTLIVKM